MRLLILGAGAWGTALALSACRQAGHQVGLWARDPLQARTLRDTRINERYLPDVALPEALTVHDGPLAPLLPGQDLIVIATPMAGLRGLLTQLLPSPVPLVWLCKGFEAPVDSPSAAAHGLLGHEIHAQLCVGPGVAPAQPVEIGAAAAQNAPAGAVAVPGAGFGILSGPSFAQEVARGRPTALVAASSQSAVRAALVQAFHGPSLRVYASDDVVGVEVGGAVKNVLAIATGLCDGLNLGLNARAALITRGLAEITRLGLALGARAETFMGLSGLGDLVLTATGDLSRNRKVGLLLAQGQTLAQAVASLGHVAEGVYCAQTVVQRAATLGVAMPIAEGVVALLDGRIRPDEAVATLMGRDPATEGV